jgi:hypothetical protein
VRILFDQGTPAPLRHHLPIHSVDTVAEKGWSTLSNGELLARAEQAGYDVLITTDQNVRYQQNLTGRNLAIIIPMSTSWPRIQLQIAGVAVAINRAHAGSYEEIPV